MEDIKNKVEGTVHKLKQSPIVAASESKIHEAEAKLRPAFDRLPDQQETVGFFKRLWARVVSFFESLRGV